MNKLNELVSVIKALNEDEVKTLQRYLHCFDAGTTDHEPKSERLLNLIVNDDKDKLKLFEKKFTKPAFSMLILRLFEKVTDSLSFDLNLKRKDAYNEFQLAKFGVKKRYIYAQVLGGKNLVQEAISQYEKIIELAKNYELYDDMIQSMYDLTNIYSGYGQIAKVDFYDREIAKYEHLRDCYRKAWSLYGKLNVRLTNSPDNMFINRLYAEAIEQLEEYYSQSRSAMVGWVLNHTKIKYYRLIGDFETAERFCVQLLNLQKNNPCIGSPSQIGNTYYLSSLNNLSMHDFHLAVLNSVKAQNYYKSNHQNLLMAKEVEFYANFYSGNLEESLYIVNSLISETDQENNEHNFAGRKYLSAGNLFLLGRYKEMNLCLNETKEIEKDREGFNISVRILNLMRLMETGSYEPADSSIESMRKHISRTIKDSEVKQRYITILKILRDLVNENFDFKNIWETRVQYFQMLCDNKNDEQGWKILSSELVPFHVWFEAKAKKLPYTQVLRSYLSNYQEKVREEEEYYSQAV